jgi:hypothetical protein
MARTRPDSPRIPTAAELCAAVKSSLSGMPRQEQLRFWQELTNSTGLGTTDPGLLIAYLETSLSDMPQEGQDQFWEELVSNPSFNAAVERAVDRLDDRNLAGARADDQFFVDRRPRTLLTFRTLWLLLRHFQAQRQSLQRKRRMGAQRRAQGERLLHLMNEHGGGKLNTAVVSEVIRSCRDWGCVRQYRKDRSRERLRRYLDKLRTDTLRAQRLGR